MSLAERICDRIADAITMKVLWAMWAIHAAGTAVLIWFAAEQTWEFFG